MTTYILKDTKATKLTIEDAIELLSDLNYKVINDEEIDSDLYLVILNEFPTLATLIDSSCNATVGEFLYDIKGL